MIFHHQTGTEGHTDKLGLCPVKWLTCLPVHLPVCLVHRYAPRHPPRQAYNTPRDTPATQLHVAAFTCDMRHKARSLKLRSSPLVCTMLRWDIVNTACSSIFVLCSGTFLQMCQGGMVFYIYHIIWPVVPRLRERHTKEFILCLDCGFCHVHLGSYAHFHLLGSCPIYLIFFFASLKIEESKKITVSGAQEST